MTSWTTESEKPNESGRLSEREQLPPLMQWPWECMAVLEVVLSPSGPALFPQQLWGLHACRRKHVQRREAHWWTMQPFWQTPSAPFYWPPRFLACSGYTPGCVLGPTEDWTGVFKPPVLSFWCGQALRTEQGTPCLVHHRDHSALGLHDDLFSLALRNLLFSRRCSLTPSSPPSHHSFSPGELWLGTCCGIMWSLSELSLWLLAWSLPKQVVNYVWISYCCVPRTLQSARHIQNSQ